MLIRKKALPRTIPSAHPTAYSHLQRDHSCRKSCHSLRQHVRFSSPCLIEQPFQVFIEMRFALRPTSILLSDSSLFLGQYPANLYPQLPLWALVSFGAYLLFKLGYGVFTFNDVPEAHAELMKEIELARADLRTKGVDVD